jgi:hypothetical protein
VRCAPIVRRYCKYCSSVCIQMICAFRLRI